MTSDTSPPRPRFKWTPKSVFFKIYDNILGRHGRCYVLRTLPKNSVGCELGVSRGDFSEYMLSLVNPRRLWLIDPWTYQPELAYEPYGGQVQKSQDEMDAMYREVSERFADRPAVRIIRKKTEQLTEEIADESLDWVYIDGCHEYEAVAADLRYFLPKVKGGG